MTLMSWLGHKTSAQTNKLNSKCSKRLKQEISSGKKRSFESKELPKDYENTRFGFIEVVPEQYCSQNPVHNMLF